MLRGDRSSESRRSWFFPVAGVVFLVGLLAFWFLQYSRVILQGDDLLNGGLAGHPYAGMTFGEWWDLYRYDYLHVNGRFTDAAVRIVLQGGREAWATIGPLLVVAVPLGGAAWATLRPRTADSRTLSRDSSVWAALVLCAMLPLFIIALRPAAAGDGIFWLSAALTHLGSALCVLIGGWPFVAAVVGHAVTRPVRWVSPIFLVLANISQETASVTMLAVVVACWVLLRGKMGRYLVLLSITSVAASAYIFLSPGLVGRAGAFQEAADGQLSLLQQLLHRGVVAGQIWLAMSAVGAAAVLVLASRLLWLGVSRDEIDRWHAALLTIAAAVLGGLAAALGPWTDTFEVVAPTAFLGGDLVTSIGLAAVLVGTCVFGLVSTYLLRELVGPVPFVLVTAGSAALAVPASLGITGERAYMIASLWWGFAAIALLLGTARLTGPLGAWVPAASALAALVFVIPTARDIDHAMEQNFAAWQATAREIGDAKGSGGARVTIGPFPYRAYLSWVAFDEARYGAYFRLYYDLPADAEVTYPPSVATS